MMMTTSNKRRTATTALSMLPAEIEMEVLLRLPVKSILRFSNVCRRWAALLSSEEFCAGWTKLAKSTATEPAAQLLFLHLTPSSPWTAVRFNEVRSGDNRLLLTFNGVRTLDAVMAPAPCRGLTLLDDRASRRYHIFNASTRAVAMLPPSPSCESTLSSTGFGFDERTKEHKVVRLVSSGQFPLFQHGFPRIRCEVYNLGRGSSDHRRWRPPTSSTDANGVVVPSTPVGSALFASMSNGAPVFTDGFLHWLVDPFYDNPNPTAYESRYVPPVLSFSLAEETFSSRVRQVPFDWHVQGAGAVHLAKLDGRLCMVRDLRGSSDRLEIWSYGAADDGGDDVWSLEHRIDLAQHAGRDLLTEAKYIKVLGSSVGKKVIFIATSKGNVVTYDPMSETLETIHQPGGGTNHGNVAYDPMSETRRSLPRVCLFEESLTPVH